MKEDVFVSVFNSVEVLLLYFGLESKWDIRVINGDFYCYRCLKRFLVLVFCDGCSYVKYCS